MKLLYYAINDASRLMSVVAVVQFGEAAGLGWRCVGKETMMLMTSSPTRVERTPKTHSSASSY